MFKLNFKGVDIDLQNNQENFYFTQSEKIFRSNFTIAHYFASKLKTIIKFKRTVVFYLKLNLSLLS